MAFSIPIYLLHFILPTTFIIKLLYLPFQLNYFRRFPAITDAVSSNGSHTIHICGSSSAVTNTVPSDRSCTIHIGYSQFFIYFLFNDHIISSRLKYIMMVKIIIHVFSR